jgi:tetratricopeptide (TPR) repeat protein
MPLSLPKKIRVAALHFAVIASIHPVTASMTPGESKVVLQSAAEALAKRDYPRALALLDPVLKEFPEDPEALNLKGAILTKQKDYDGADACYRAALKASPDFFPAIYNIGAIMVLKQQWDPAIAYHEDLLNRQPGNELVQYKLLLLLLSRDSKPELQARLFSSETPSGTPAWYFARAARCYKAGKKGDALKYLDVARSVFGDQAQIFQEELDESGLKEGALNKAR